MKHKISVNLEDFKTILKKTRVSQRIGKKNYANETVKISYAAGQLKIEVMGVRRLLDASGLHTWGLEMPLSKYQHIIKFKPTLDPLNIEIDDELKQLKIGTTSFKI